MIVEHDLDCAAIYERLRQDLVAVLGGLDAEQLSTRVPATPDWSVRDVLSHVAGIAHDLNHGDFGEDGGDDEGRGDRWTARQVAARRTCTVAEVAAEWDREAPTFLDGLRLFGYELGSHYVGDLLQHVCDVRHALGLPRLADDDALTAALDFYLDSFHETLVAAGIGAVRVEAGETAVVVGPEVREGAGGVVAELSAEPFELLRSLGGRRDEAQIRALGWSGDVEPVLPWVSRYGVPTTGLID